MGSECFKWAEPGRNQALRTFLPLVARRFLALLSSRSATGGGLAGTLLQSGSHVTAGSVQTLRWGDYDATWLASEPPLKSRLPSAF